jgi:hypothetical protein
VTAVTGVGAVESFGIVGLSNTVSLVVNLETTMSYATVLAQTIDFMKAA